MRPAWFLGAALVWALSACGDGGGGSAGDDDGDDDDDDTQESDGGRDAGRDAGGGGDGSMDAGRDSGAPDAGRDSGAPDAGRDSGAADAGRDGGIVDSGLDGGGDAAVADAGPVTFELVYDSILAPKCSSANCHGGNDPAGNLDFSSENDAYDDLVGEDANGPQCEDSDLVRVVEGNPGTSLLVLKLEGNPPPCGARMPAGGMPALSASEIALIRAWIQQGADED